MNDCRMVLFKTAMLGTVVLVIGVLLLNYGGQFITIMVQSTQRTDVEPHAEFLVGDVVQRSYSLPAPVTVFGLVKTTQAPTNQSGDVRFLVFDEPNYQKWNMGGQADSAYSSEKQGQFNFTFATGKSGSYHFVFDNRASMYKKYVVFSMSYNEIVRSQVPDARIQYVAWALLIGGALLLVVGLVRKPPIRWA
ncbi:MAG: hypothetical protein ABSF09_10015 [Candidatus Bathyarchaeia archaeon]|jgi:hypothetical protein